MSDQSSKSVEYRLVPNHPFYRAGDDGSVWSYKVGGRWKRLKMIVTQYGYHSVSIDGKRYLVHHLVLLSFGFDRQPGAMTRHLNNNRMDNRLENIIWGTALENQRDRDRHGTANKGEINPMSKLTESDIRRIISDEFNGMSQSEIGVIFGVGGNTICRIRSRKRWKHLV